MPEILNIYPLDVHTEIRFALSELNKLADYFDNCEFQGDLENDELKEANRYVKEEFFPFLDALTEDLMKGAIKNGIRSNSTGSKL